MGCTRGQKERRKDRKGKHFGEALAIEQGGFGLRFTLHHSSIEYLHVNKLLGDRGI